MAQTIFIKNFIEQVLISLNKTTPTQTQEHKDKDIAAAWFKRTLLVRNSVKHSPCLQSVQLKFIFTHHEWEKMNKMA